LGKINGKNASLPFTIPKEFAEKYESIVYNSMLSQGGLPNDESVGVAKQTLHALYVADNLNLITEYVWGKAQSDAVKKEIEEYHNPSVTGKQGNVEVVKQTDQQTKLGELLGLKTT
jgi:hypothetical protein